MSSVRFHVSKPVSLVLGVMFIALSAASGTEDHRDESFGKWALLSSASRSLVPIEKVRVAYRFGPLRRDGKVLVMNTAKTQVRFTIGSRECLMNGLKFILTEPVTELAGSPQLSRIDLEKIINPVLRPSHIRDAGNFNTVILDPGHGGSDPGAINSLGTEATYNLQVGQKARAMLEKSDYRVVMTRQSDRYLTLQQRVDLANAVLGNAVFISIHFNSGGADARGIETFTLSPTGVSHYGRGLLASDFSARTGNRQDSANIALATAFHGSLKRRLGGDAKTIDRGIKRARFTVLSGVRHPAILIEGGFMSHPHEARLIANDAYRAAVANSIVDAVARYRAAVTRKPVAATTTVR